MKKPSNVNKAFGVAEGILFLLALAALAAFFTPSIQAIQQQKREAEKAHALSILESAKNQYEQSAEKKQKEHFAKAGDTERFQILSHLITPSQPEAFSKTYGLQTIKINNLGENVEVE